MAGVKVRQLTKKNPDGSIVKGSWQYRFVIAPVGGKPQRFEKAGFAKKSDAQKAGMIAYNEYMNAGQTFTPSEISVSDFFDLWLSQYCEINLKATTIEGYRKILRNHILPELGHYRLCNITATAIQQFINEKFNEGFSRNTLSSMKGILNGSFSYAVHTLQLIKVNPCLGVKLPMRRAESKVKTRTHKRVVVPKEVMKQVLSRFPKGHPYHIPIQLGYRCGLRLGEVFGLTWDDIDINEGTLTVHRQCQMDNDVKLWRLLLPKYDSIRVISLDNTMLNILSEAKQEQQKNAKMFAELYCPLYLDETNHITTDKTPKQIQLINVREDGSFISPRAMQHAFRVIHGKDNPNNKNKTNNALNFDFDFHSLRHTHATMLLSEGVSPVLVKERLGHKNIETTLGIYAHVTKDMNDIALDILNKLD